MNVTTIKRSYVLAAAFAITILMQLALAIPAHAVVTNDARAWVSGAVWDGGGSTYDFSEAANWEGDVVPVSGEAVSLNTTGMAGATFNVDLSTESAGVSAFGYIRLGGTGSGTFTLTGDDLVLNSGIDNDGDLYNYPTFVVENNLTLSGNSDFRAGAKLIIGATDGSSTLDLSTFTMTKKGENQLKIYSVVSGSGDVTVSNGDFVALEDSTVALTIGSGGTLKGNATVGDVTVQSGGEVAPGLSPGCLTTGDLTYVSGATYTVEIDGATECSGYDKTTVVGTVDLGGATLSIVKLASYTPEGTTEFTIIDNDVADPVTGTFAGLAEGGTTTVDGVEYTISYVGGDGNDVVLSAVAVATPAAPDTGFSSTAVNFLFIAMATLLATGGMVIAGRKLENADVKN